MDVAICYHMECLVHYGIPLLIIQYFVHGANNISSKASHYAIFYSKTFRRIVTNNIISIALHHQVLHTVIYFVLLSTILYHGIFRQLHWQYWTTEYFIGFVQRILHRGIFRQWRCITIIFRWLSISLSILHHGIFHRLCKRRILHRNISSMASHC